MFGVAKTSTFIEYLGLGVIKTVAFTEALGSRGGQNVNLNISGQKLVRVGIRISILDNFWAGPGNWPE